MNNPVLPETPPIDKDHWRDLDAIASAVSSCLSKHPISVPLYSSTATYAWITNMLPSSFDEVHPSSHQAMAMAAIAQGIAEAVIYRISVEFSWTEADRDRAMGAISTRLKQWPCGGIMKDERCGATIDRPDALCDQCNTRLDAIIADKT